MAGKIKTPKTCSGCSNHITCQHYYVKGGSPQCQAALQADSMKWVKINAFRWPHGGGLVCEEKCPQDSVCASHMSAGDFRSEDGATPKIKIENGELFCKSKRGYFLGVNGMVKIEKEIPGSFERHLKSCAQCKPKVPVKYVIIRECNKCPYCSMPLCLADPILDGKLGNGEGIPAKCPLKDLPKGLD